jgi:pre-mRNA-splicing helicase BRR2
MSRPTYSAITAHAKDAKPAIVFVPTRKHARLTALDLLTFAAAEGEPARFLQVRHFSPTPSLIIPERSF